MYLFSILKGLTKGEPNLLKYINDSKALRKSKEKMNPPDAPADYTHRPRLGNSAQRDAEKREREIERERERERYIIYSPDAPANDIQGLWVGDRAPAMHSSQG